MLITTMSLMVFITRFGSGTLRRMRCALGNDTFCSNFENEFLACTACLEEFAEDKAQVTEDKARQLIAEALRKETRKPKFYEDYCRKKIGIAQAIGLIPSVSS